MLDLHYGISTPRGVATDLSAETQNHAKSIAQVGAKFVAAAERVRNRIGRNPAGDRQVFLCHAFCEVGATKAVVALSAMHRFLVRHPEEVVVLSIEDDISAADTAAAIRSSGLVDEVYLGDAGEVLASMAQPGAPVRLTDESGRVVTEVTVPRF